MPKRASARVTMLFLAVAASYALGSELAFSWFGAGGNASFFPAAGVTVAALVCSRRAFWPAVIAAAALAEIAVDLHHELSFAAATWYAVANTAQPVAAALLLGLFTPRVNLASARDLRAFVGSAVIAAPVVGAVVGASTFVMVESGSSWLRFAAEWWLGDGLGVLVVGTAVVSLRAGGPSSAGRAVEAFTLGVGAAASTAALFWLEWLPLVFVPVVLLLAIGLRIGIRGVAISGAVVAFLAAEAASQQHVFWNSLDVPSDTGTLYLQAALGIVIATALAFASEVRVREQALIARTAAEAARAEADLGTRRAHRVRVFAERVAGAVTQEDVGAAFLDEAFACVDVVAGALMVVSDRDRTLTLAAALGDHELNRHWPRVLRPSNVSLIGAAFASFEPVTIASRAELEQRFPTTAEKFGPGVDAAVAISVRAFGSPVGVVALFLAEERQIESDVLEVLTTMASVCGQALERARLFEREQRARFRAELLQANATRLASALAEKDVSSAVLEDIGELGVDFAAVFDLRDAHAELLASRGIGGGLAVKLDDGSLAVDLLVPSALRSGETVAFAAGEALVARHALLADPETGLGLRSVVGLPLRAADGSVIGALMAGWTDETGLLPATRQLLLALSDQTGLALERVHAETALRDSEARYRTLFTSIDEGFCLAELIVDADGNPVDFRFLEVNARFEQQSGLVAPVGRTALELMPDLEPHWLERYARVGLGGETLRFEERSEVMGRWFDVFATPVESKDGGRFALVFNDITLRKRVEEELKAKELVERRGRQRAELLAELMSSLEAVDGADARMQRLVELLVPRVADYATVELPDEQNPVVAIAHRDARLVEPLRLLRTEHRLDACDAFSVARSTHAAESQLIAELSPALVEEYLQDDETKKLFTAIDPHSHIAVPLLLGPTERGVLMLGLGSRDRRPYSRDDLLFIEEIAARVGAVIGSARLRDQAQEIALGLQNALLPSKLVRDPSVAIGATYRAGSDGLEVGGDWYDAFALPDGRVALTVGDVVGKGLEAAAAMGRLRTAIAAYAPHADDPGTLLSRLEAFAAGSNGADFATALCAYLDVATGELRYASAGHPPILRVAADGSTSWLEGGRSSPLCCIPAGVRNAATVALDPGDLLILYSDGLVERRRERISAGLERLAAAGATVKDAPIEEICERLLDEISGTASGEDDIVVMCVRFSPDDAARFRHVFPALPEELAGLRAATRSWLDVQGHAEPTRRSLLVALGEAVTNAVEHAYDGRERGRVEVAIEPAADDPWLLVRVRDAGSWRAGADGGGGRGTRIIEGLSESHERRSNADGTTVSFRIRTDAGNPG